MKLRQNENFTNDVSWTQYKKRNIKPFFSMILIQNYAAQVCDEFVLCTFFLFFPLFSPFPNLLFVGFDRKCHKTAKTSNLKIIWNETVKILSVFAWTALSRQRRINVNQKCRSLMTEKIELFIIEKIKNKSKRKENEKLVFFPLHSLGNRFLSIPISMPNLFLPLVAPSVT